MWVLPSAPSLSHTSMNAFLMWPATPLVFQSFSKGRDSRGVQWVLQNLRSRLGTDKQKDRGQYSHWGTFFQSICLIKMDRPTETLQSYLRFTCSLTWPCLTASNRGRSKMSVACSPPSSWDRGHWHVVTSPHTYDVTSPCGYSQAWEIPGVFFLSCFLISILSF